MMRNDLAKTTGHHLFTCTKDGEGFEKIFTKSKGEADAKAANFRRDAKKYTCGWRWQSGKGESTL